MPSPPGSWLAIFQTNVLLVRAHFHAAGLAQPAKFIFQAGDPPLREFSHGQLGKLFDDLFERLPHRGRIRAQFHLKVGQHVEPVGNLLGLVFWLVDQLRQLHGGQVQPLEIPRINQRQLLTHFEIVRVRLEMFYVRGPPACPAQPPAASRTPLNPAARCF